MLLQTMVQLNILLLAAPALAGWSVLPAGHPLLVQAARVVISLPAARAVEERLAVQAAPRPAAVRSLTVTKRPADPGAPGSLPVPVEPAAALFSPFPHAARAP